MIEETIVGIEGFDQVTQTFIPAPKTRTIRLEHSLISISKWEEQTKRRFLSKVSGPKTKEDWIVYMQCMSLDGPIDPLLLQCVTDIQFDRIVKYIQDNKTATTGLTKKKPSSGKPKEMSSEMIYCYMAFYRLPWYAEKWHLSRLLTMIDVADELQNGGKGSKMNWNDTMSRYARINERNRKRFHTKG